MEVKTKPSSEKFSRPREVNDGDSEIAKMADHVIEVKDTMEVFSPLLTTIPLQLLSYHIAVMRGCNVDQPRNLAKSVTVE